MPTYDYLCQKCNHIFERRFNHWDEKEQPLGEPCPECKEEKSIVQTMTKAPGLVSDSKTAMRRAGSEWNDRLKQIKKGSGRDNTIKT